MCVSAYGASPAQSPAEGVTLGGIGINVQPESDLRPAIDVVIERIRADAKTRDGGGAHKLSAAQRASAWDKLRLLDWDEAYLGSLVRGIFGVDDFTTPGQAAAVFYWLRDEHDKTLLNPVSAAEAKAILDSLFADEPSGEESESENMEDSDDQ
jgi:hypothetical protein